MSFPRVLSLSFGARVVGTSMAAGLGFALIVAAVGLAAVAQAQDQPAAKPPQNAPQAAPPARATGKKAVAKKPTSEGQADPFRAHVVPLLRKYCFDCHGEKKQESDVVLHKAENEEAVLAERAMWESVLEMIEGQAMPPANKPQPTPAERRQIVRRLEQTLFDLDCDQPHDPGRVTIRRLNRTEYNNTIRDLLGVDFRPADDFPSDDVGHGFDNIGDVLSVSPLLVEKYLNSAERVASAAVAPLIAAKRETYLRSGKELEVHGDAKLSLFGAHAIMGAGGVSGKFAVPRRGEYVIRVRAAAQQAGPEVAKMRVDVGDRPRGTVEVPATPDMPADYMVRTRLEQGEQRVTATFVNDYYNPDAADPKQRDRNLFITSIEVEGPYDAPPKSSANGGGLTLVRPDDNKSVAVAARETLAPLVRRGLRRAVRDEDLNKYVALVELVVGRNESYERGIEVALTALLVSPEFIFRFEGDPDPNDAERKHTINDFELATRLSYFLWSSLPDDELLAVAERGELQRDDVLIAQTKRLLADPRSRAIADNFASQWLNLRGLEEVAPDPKKFEGFNASMRADLRKETELVFDTILREERPILDFLDADFTFVNERLSKHYGVGKVLGSQFQRVSLKESNRLGILTHGSILTLTSNPTRTSPVKRGKWIMENILGTPPPDPPANAPELAETQKAHPDATLRQQLEIHRANPNCAVCHVTMDQLGFGFENFDAIGRWRDQDGSNPVDASGVLPGGAKFAGPRELVTILKSKKAEFSRTLAERLLTYGLGRGLEFYDRCAVDDIVARLDREEYRFSALVLGIVQSEPFRMRRGEGAKP